MATAQHGLITRPLWLSKGERFRPTGAYVFLQIRHEEFRLSLKKLKEEQREILAVIRKRKRQSMVGNGGEHTSSDGDTDDDEEIKVEIRNKALLSMTRQEMKQLKEVGKDHAIDPRLISFSSVNGTENERDAELDGTVQE